MELEFDKEIDAILREKRGGGAAVVTTVPHLDADAVAAFVENALPDKMRRLYTGHFADCDRCRKLLSSTILTTQTAASMAAVGAAEVISASEAAIPWYSQIFRTPSLALAMGALVLTFSGVLGYFLIQSRNADLNSSVATSSNKAAMKDSPTYSESAPNANSNAAAANAAANTANTALIPSAATPAAPETDSKDKGPNSTTESKLADSVDGFATAEKERAASVSSAAPEPPKTTAAAPPPPPADDKSAGVSGGSMRERKEESKKDEDLSLAKRAAGEDARRDMPASPAKTGPTRGVGPVQNQSNQINQQGVFDMPVTRIVGGKTFENRNGAWYDRAYRNQGTTNVRRGSDEYKKLDKGLRSIANNLGGTVVILWKDKAYRIQ